MNAKFGKISIGCFVAFWAVALLSAGMCASFVSLHPTFLAWAICLPPGIITGILGARRRESPQWYSIAGFLLNAGIFVLLFMKGDL